MKFFLPFLLVWITTCFKATNQVEVVYAVNCGGATFTDSNGIHYQKDVTTRGSASAWNKVIYGVPCQDLYLYQTHRWDDKWLAYDLPLTGDGWYGLLLHLTDDSEPPSRKRGMNITLNNAHNLVFVDFYRDCGPFIACNHIFYFKLCGNTLHYNGQSSTVANAKNVELRLETFALNTLIQGILLVKGKAAEGMPIAGTKTVFYFDPKKEVLCPGEVREEKHQLECPGVVREEKHQPECPVCPSCICECYDS